MSTMHDVAVIGAGPYGLASAAHMRARGLDVYALGRPMELWERQMPTGMFLRSSWEASTISDPDGASMPTRRSTPFAWTGRSRLPTICATPAGTSAKLYPTSTSVASYTCAAPTRGSSCGWTTTIRSPRAAW